MEWVRRIDRTLERAVRWLERRARQFSATMEPHPLWREVSFALLMCAIPLTMRLPSVWRGTLDLGPALGSAAAWGLVWCLTLVGLAQLRKLRRRARGIPGDDAPPA